MTQPAPTIQSEDISEINYRGFVALKAKLGVDIMAQLTEQKAHMLHMAIGVAGEAAELLASNSMENTIEECGDLEFFLEGLTINNNIFQANFHSLYSMLNVQVKLKNIEELKSIIKLLAIEAGTLLDTIKKYTIYNKKLDTAILTSSWRVIHNYLEAIYVYLGVTRVKVLQMNADKLNKRYKAGYSDKEAQERADKKEGN